MGHNAYPKYMLILRDYQLFRPVTVGEMDNVDTRYFRPESIQAHNVPLRCKNAADAGLQSRICRKNCPEMQKVLLMDIAE